MRWTVWSFKCLKSKSDLMGRARAAFGFTVALTTLLALPVFAQTVETRLGGTVARFENPTTRYGHNVLGDLPEWGRLCLHHRGRGTCIELPQTSVFEDIEPRLADFNDDGVAEAVVVESSVRGGASLVVYGLTTDGYTRVATPPIGRRNRWLAPIGIEDFNSDGQKDVAYVETPHLGKTIKIWTVGDNELTLLAQIPGFTNHRIGDRHVTSGVRDCGAGPEIVIPDEFWTNVKGLTLRDGKVLVRDLGPYDDDVRFETYVAC